MDPTRRGVMFGITRLGCTLSGSILSVRCEIIEATSETSQLCSRCYMIFLDPRNVQALLAKDEYPRRVEHHNPAELKSCALSGCSFCSQVSSSCEFSSAFNSCDEQDNRLFLAISPTSDLWDSGIILSVARNDVHFIILHWMASLPILRS
jgi:hypothetical protein